MMRTIILNQILRITLVVLLGTSIGAQSNSWWLSLGNWYSREKIDLIIPAHNNKTINFLSLKAGLTWSPLDKLTVFAEAPFLWSYEYADIGREVQRLGWADLLLKSYWHFGDLRLGPAATIPLFYDPFAQPWLGGGSLKTGLAVDWTIGDPTDFFFNLQLEPFWYLTSALTKAGSFEVLTYASWNLRRHTHLFSLKLESAWKSISYLGTNGYGEPYNQFGILLGPLYGHYFTESDFLTVSLLRTFFGFQEIAAWNLTVTFTQYF
jgi:hypothetical protein